MADQLTDGSTFQVCPRHHRHQHHTTCCCSHPPPIVVPGFHDNNLTIRYIDILFAENINICWTEDSRTITRWQCWGSSLWSPWWWPPSSAGLGLISPLLAGFCVQGRFEVVHILGGCKVKIFLDLLVWSDIFTPLMISCGCTLLLPSWRRRTRRNRDIRSRRMEPMEQVLEEHSTFLATRTYSWRLPPWIWRMLSSWGTTPSTSGSWTSPSTPWSPTSSARSTSQSCQKSPAWRPTSLLSGWF